jgi:ATP-dependent Clp endopeptidase proteolytic subunit ClpP
VRIDILGPIAESYNDARELVPLISDTKDARIDIRINSPGGSIWDSIAISNALRESAAATHATVMGVCASAATLILASADRATAARGSRLMIHSPWSAVKGTVQQMRAEAERLEAITGDLLDIYDAKMHASRDEIAEMLERETWFSARAAFDAGLVDAVSGDEAQALTEDFDQLWALYKGTPDDLFSDAFMREPEYRSMLQADYEAILKMMN